MSRDPTASITRGSLPNTAQQEAQQEPQQAKDLSFQLLTFESDRLQETSSTQMLDVKIQSKI